MPKKTGISQFQFYLASVLVVIALWGLKKYVLYRPQVMFSEPAPPLSSAQQNETAATMPLPNSPQSQSPAAAPPPSSPQSQAPATTGPSKWVEMSVTLENNTGALMTTLATGLFAAIGLLMSQDRKNSKKCPTWPAFLAALCAGISLFFGACSQGHLLSMLEGNNFNTQDKVYSLLNNAQFAFLCAGACFLAGFAFYDLNKES